MGLVINQGIENLSFEDLLDQMNIDHDFRAIGVPIHFGGPVEAGRGLFFTPPIIERTAPWLSTTTWP